MNDEDRDLPAGAALDNAGPSRNWRRGALILVLVGIAVWAYGRGSEDWRYQLAGLADPFLGRPSPGSGVAVNVVISAIVGGLTLLGRAVLRRVRSSSARSRDAGRWRWWWLLVAGWAGYVAGGAVVIAGGGSIDVRGSMHLEFGAPLGSVVDVPATCRPVVGDPEMLAEVSATANGLPRITLRDITTGRVREPVAYLANDGVPGNGFEPPNVPDRPAPYILSTSPDGSTQAELPITFVEAYDYHVTGLVESGLSGVADLTGMRWKDPFGAVSLHWVNLAIANDPWPETYELRVSWTCDPMKP